MRVDQTPHERTKLVGDQRSVGDQPPLLRPKTLMYRTSQTYRDNFQHRLT